MFSIYFAGDLFDQKHITGNLLLARQIEHKSSERYTCILPQNWEGKVYKNTIDIRNKDIAAIINADMVLFNFDGTDLDSGTVVEFMIAKMLDIPAVILRTDCRVGGYLNNEDWNLMVNGFPRCAIVKHSALFVYNQLGLDIMHNLIADSVINAFENLLLEKSLFYSAQEMFYAYKHIIKLCGSDLDQLITDSDLKRIIDHKIQKNCYFDSTNNKIESNSQTIGEM